LTDVLGLKGSCDVVMKVKPNSRAIVGGGVSIGTTADSCKYIGQVATSMESLLPKNN
jgi:hypothetical protein